MAYLHEALRMTADEHLDLEAEHDGPLELIDGTPHGMRERDPRFFRVLVNLSTALKRQLPDSTYAVLIQGQHVRVGSHDVIYPDAVVLGPSPAGCTPRLVIEILSADADEAELQRRAAAAKRIRSLVEFISVDIERRSVTVHHRDAAGDWMEVSDPTSSSLDSLSLGLRVPLSSVFDGLDRQEPRLTLDEFIAWDADEELRYEFIGGRIFAMTGAVLGHVRVTMNLAFAIDRHLRGTRCRCYMADARLVAEETGDAFFPDVAIACSSEPDGAQPAMSPPLALIEVQSRSTERRDRSTKLHAYCQMASLQEYVLVDHARRRMDVYRRGKADVWSLRRHEGDEALELRSIDLSIPSTEIYRDVAPAT